MAAAEECSTSSLKTPTFISTHDCSVRATAWHQQYHPSATPVSPLLHSIGFFHAPEDTSPMDNYPLRLDAVVTLASDLADDTSDLVRRYLSSIMGIYGGGYGYGGYGYGGYGYGGYPSSSVPVYPPPPTPLVTPPAPQPPVPQPFVPQQPMPQPSVPQSPTPISVRTLLRS